MNNKKILLRERKRHTARRVASACYADLLGRGVPHLRSGGEPISGWGVPHPRVGGVPHPRVGGVPPRPGMGYPPPPTPDLGWATPNPDMGWVTPPPFRPGWDTPPPPHLRPEMGYPPDLRWGTPTPLQTWDWVSPRKCEQTENITFPHSFGCGR